MHEIFDTGHAPEHLLPRDNSNNGTELPLFGKFFKPRTIAILSGDSPFHRSALAVQIAKSIAFGDVVPGIEKTTYCTNVLYIDGHRSRKEFFAQYTDSETGRVFDFQDHFTHAAFLKSNWYPDSWSSSFENKLDDALKALVDQFKPKVLIFDSADWLFSLGCTTKELNQFMLHIHRFVIENGISVLFLVSPVNRALASSWTANRQLKMFFRTSGSVFSVNRSRMGSDCFYLKDELSAENTPDVGQMVMKASLRFEDAFCKFSFHGYQPEFLHSLSRPRNFSLCRRDYALQLRGAGYSLQDIGTHLGVSKVAIHKMLSSPAYPDQEALTSSGFVNLVNDQVNAQSSVEKTEIQ